MIYNNITVLDELAIGVKLQINEDYGKDSIFSKVNNLFYI